MDSHPEQPDRVIALVGIAITGVMAAALVGAITNAINGVVSPMYFVWVLEWYHVDNIWRAAVARGAIEGVMFGVVFSLIFTLATAVITNISCDYRFAAKHLLGIVLSSLCLGLLGGLAGMGVALQKSDYFPDAPGDFDGMLAFAWVRGSMLGAELGGLVSVIVGIAFFRANWRRRLCAETIAQNKKNTSAIES